LCSQLSGQSNLGFEIFPSGAVLPKITKADKANLNPKEGQIFYNPEIEGIMLFNGADWIRITGEKVVTVTDIDGNTYQTVEIDGLTWLTSNLNTTRLNDGTPLTMGGSGSRAAKEDNKSSSATPTLWYYNNDPVTFGPTYGALYNHCAVATGLLCPTGYRVATFADFSSLTTALGGDEVAGGEMKEAGTVHWVTPNVGATNSSGWTGLPGGLYGFGVFNGIGIFGLYWVGDSVTPPLVRVLQTISLSLGADQLDSAGNGASVRCVK